MYHSFLKAFYINCLSPTCTLLILHWNPSNGNPITQLLGILDDDTALITHFSRIGVKNRSGSVQGVFKIESTRPFVKKNYKDNVFNWLQSNKLWAKLTNLQYSVHLNIGWSAGSNPVYTNFVNVVDELMLRMENTHHLKLAAHKLVWRHTSSSVPRHALCQSHCSKRQLK